MNNNHSSPSAKKPVLTVGAMIGATLLAKLLGLLRSVLLASHYGTGEEASAFSAAARIPLSFFDLLFSAAILGCFIPVYNSFREDKQGASRFACGFLSLVLTATGLFAALGILFAEPIVSVIAPGFAPETAALAARLLRILFPMILFTGSTYTLVGILQSGGRFLLPALISSISNAGVIAYFLLLDNRLGSRAVYGLAFAYLLSWLIQFLTLAIPLLCDGKRFVFRLNLKDPALLKALKMSLPIMLGSGLTPLGLLAGTFFSSFVCAGGNVIFEYGVNVFTMCAGILTYSICNYLFPTLSRLSDDTQQNQFCEASRTGLLASGALILPFTSALSLLAREIVSVLYERRVFSLSDTLATSSVVRVLAFAMPAFAVIEIFSRMFYAKAMPRIPMLAALGGTAALLIGGSLSVFLFRTGLDGIGLAYALGLIVSALLLILFSLRKLKGLYDRSFCFALLRLVFAFAVFTVLLFFLHGLCVNRFGQTGMLSCLLCAVIPFIPACAVYLLLIRVLRIPFSSDRRNLNESSRQ